jgi:hypothetical protein
MTSRVYSLYKAVFDFLLNSCNIVPEKVSCDFEHAMRKGIRSTWKKAKVNGCFYHYCQAVRRKKASFPDLSKLIKKNKSAEKSFRMMLRIPLLPADRMKTGLDALFGFQKKHRLFRRFGKLNLYFVKQWHGKYRYNIHGEQYRTNNYAEAYNSKIKRIIPRNPSTYTFLSE